LARSSTIFLFRLVDGRTKSGPERQKGTDSNPVNSAEDR
jgi:hypothetical protein